MKKILISIVDGFHYRYLIDTGIIDELIKNNIKIDIFTIQSLFDKLKNKYKNIESLNIHILEKFEESIYSKLYMKSIQLQNIKLTETLNIKAENTKKAGCLINNIIKILPFKYLQKHFESKYYEDMLNKFNPDLVVLSTPAQKPLDFKLAYMANKLGYKTLSPVYSWDNLTAKGPFYFSIDYLIVWNEIMKQEAIHYHNYSEKNCFVEGVPVFDIYASMQNIDLEEKNDFFKKLGLDIEKKVICITTIPEVYFGSCHNEIIKSILNYFRKVDLQLQILVRPHPLDETDYSLWKNDNDVIIDYYGTMPDKTLKYWNPQEDNTKHLALTMKYSDVVINIASTITIDAACFDTPIINIAYDMKEDDNEYIGSIERYYKYTHYKHVVTTGAAKMAYSDIELFDTIKVYLMNRNLDQKNRQNLVEKQAYKLDGQSGIRIARRIIEIIK